MFDKWSVANRLLAAKILSELHFEEVLNYEVVEKAVFEKAFSDTQGETDASTPAFESALGVPQYYRLVTPHRDWFFVATRSIWGMFVVEPESVVNADQHPVEAGRLLLDIQSFMKMKDIHMSGLIEEVQQTLYADCVYLQKLDSISAEALVQISETERQQYLKAHPKAVANKGRLGWGIDELDRYTPEAGQRIQLHCLAIHKAHCRTGFREDLSQSDLWQRTFGKSSWQHCLQRLKHKQVEGKQVNPDDYWLTPVHPWQFNRFLLTQYASLFARGDLIDLGVLTGDWIAQQSIRTLSPSEQGEFDIKTAITILNTSCYRGIPGDFIVHGPRLSRWLAQQVSTDPLLSELGLHVQQEVAGIYCSQPLQAELEKGAYRYKEMLGCIWRERAESVIGDGLRPMSMATLMQTDAQGKSCIDALISLSDLSAEQWLRRMFRHVVVPLYHLMCRYGVALVAHGQNITLVLDEQHRPVGCIIKDFHGDLRLVDKAFPELESLDKDIQDNVTRLPSHYLIHDLLTGHFVTVLRFVSPLLAQHKVSEEMFYHWLAEEIRQYQSDHPQLQARFELFNLLSEKIEKVCINRVRFKIGYDDSDERPLPELGEPIANPLRAVDFA
ncbi:IucA/IucC family protein [Alteromonas sp. a30]|nr:IucA/IucC family protein [Alteromonas sp. a30]